MHMQNARDPLSPLLTISPHTHARARNGDTPRTRLIVRRHQVQVQQHYTVHDLLHLPLLDGLRELDGESAAEELREDQLVGSEAAAGRLFFHG